MNLEPSKGKAVVKILKVGGETKTDMGIILPENQSKTKEITQGEILAINDPDDITGGYVVGDIVAFRNVSVLPIGGDKGLLNVLHIEGKVL